MKIGLRLVILLVGIVLLSIYFPKRHITPSVKLGIDVLEERNFDILQQKNIGILTNNAGIDSKGNQTWKVLKNAPGVNLKAIFAPVHGLKGNFMWLETFFDDEVDDIPVYSVYASNSRPKDEWLQGLDAVVVDLQGIGTRFYNYWAFMVYVMAACFENNIEVIVLDRPNPLGGHYLGGSVMDAENTSIWGPIPGMPLFHGMTIGELARYCKEIPEGIVSHQQIVTGVVHSGLSISAETLKNGKLTIIPMEGWTRDMTWKDTGLKWIQTSPNIPNLQSAHEYAVAAPIFLLTPTCEFDSCNFLKFEPDWNKHLPYHEFSSRYTVPQNIVQYVNDMLKGRPSSGFTLEVDRKNPNLVVLNVTDIRKTIPGFLGLALIALAQRHTKFYFYNEDSLRIFGAHVGDRELLQKLAQMERIQIQYFEEKWKKSTAAFLEKTKPFHLYE